MMNVLLVIVQYCDTFVECVLQELFVLVQT